MTFPDLRYFKPSEFSNPGMMETALLEQLDEARHRLGYPLRITSSFRPGAVAPSGGPSQHAAGAAVDMHSPGMPCVELYLALERMELFGGIGIYPWWTHPGVHVDIGPRGRRWVCASVGRYYPLTMGTLVAAASR